MVTVVVFLFLFLVEMQFPDAGQAAIASGAAVSLWVYVVIVNGLITLLAVVSGIHSYFKCVHNRK